MKLNLNKPICFFDLETTGTNPGKDKIVEIAVLKLDINNQKKEMVWRINPECPIPEEASSIHGITDEMVKDQPTFKHYSKEIHNFIEGCDLGGYNIDKFDLPLLVEEFIRSGIDVSSFVKVKTVDVQTIFFKKEPRDLSSALKFYCNKDHGNAHTALDDTIATYEVLLSQLDKYDDLEPSVDFLSTLTKRNKSIDFAGRIIEDDDGDAIFNFGKHKGKKVKEILTEEKGYYSWMMNSDFPEYTKKIITQVKLGLIN
ncbi:MAG: 3'-5' exonuclease [Bacteroidota bacterium]|nr:3'-5' exonuclease [Bacteroidota bacterium]